MGDSLRSSLPQLILFRVPWLIPAKLGLVSFLRLMESTDYRDFASHV